MSPLHQLQRWTYQIQAVLNIIYICRIAVAKFQPIANISILFVKSCHELIPFDMIVDGCTFSLGTDAIKCFENSHIS